MIIVGSGVLGADIGGVETCQCQGAGIDIVVRFPDWSEVYLSSSPAMILGVPVMVPNEKWARVSHGFFL